MAKTCSGTEYWTPQAAHYCRNLDLNCRNPEVALSNTANTVVHSTAMRMPHYGIRSVRGDMNGGEGGRARRQSHALPLPLLFMLCSCLRMGLALRLVHTHRDTFLHARVEGGSRGGAGLSGPRLCARVLYTCFFLQDPDSQSESSHR